jgi:hypothetical protein
MGGNAMVINRRLPIDEDDEYAARIAVCSSCGLIGLEPHKWQSVGDDSNITLRMLCPRCQNSEVV